MLASSRAQPENMSALDPVCEPTHLAGVAGFCMTDFSAMQSDADADKGRRRANRAHRTGHSENVGFWKTLSKATSLMCYAEKASPNRVDFQCHSSGHAYFAQGLKPAEAKQRIRRIITRAPSASVSWF